MTIGTLVAFTALQGTLFRPLMSLLNVGVDVTASLAMFSRIFEYQDLPIEIDDPATPADLGEVRGDVTLERVSFSYDAGSPTCSTTSTCTSRPALHSPSSARRAAARPRSPGW